MSFRPVCPCNFQPQTTIGESGAVIFLILFFHGHGDDSLVLGPGMGAAGFVSNDKAGITYPDPKNHLSTGTIPVNVCFAQGPTISGAKDQ